MTLEEAIKHAEEVASENKAEATKIAREKKPFLEYARCKQCANDHEQLAEWLKELKALRAERPKGEWISSHSDFSFMNCGRKCSICDYVVEFSTNFCPNCGANMREGGQP